MLDMFDGQDINNERKMFIPSDFLINITSPKGNISYTIVSLIMHDGESLECGNYVSDVFDVNVGIWWKCNDDEINEISDLPLFLFTRESKNYKQESNVWLRKTIFGF